MNPYTLYPLGNRQSAPVDGRSGLEVSIAAYRAVDAVATGAARLAAAIGNWRKRRRAIDELSRLSDHMLKDIGVARGEIRAVVDGLLDAPKARPHRRPRLVAANSPARPVPTAAANDNAAGLAA